jgi:uncharacterized protein (TIGR00645 family)
MAEPERRDSAGVAGNSAVERLMERAIFGCRWLQAPLYVGLMLALALLVVKFFAEFIHLFATFLFEAETSTILGVLTLVDLVMVANLIVMVTISGYENFVSRIDIKEASDKLSWFGKLDAGSLKIKLAVSIIAISAIHLLKSFLNNAEVPNDKMIILVIVHLTFIGSALALAWLDRITGYRAVGAAAKD